ncbi:hypothetical protein HanRHA438_Chr16g0774651 [Helianthus annuus]|nr:hypothetical protein HanRHA438_Chr16g0774651 [Helianthus annuus]
MGKQRLSDNYRQLDSAPKDKGSSSSKQSVDTEEGIFVREAQFEKPLSPNKRSLIITKSQEKIKKPQPKRMPKETQEIGNNPPWEDELDEK